MDHVAIDLGGRESQICVRAEDGRVIEERRCRTEDLEQFFQQRAPARVIVETCAEAFHAADAAAASGHDVRVVPATLVRALGVGSRRTKTDKRDAQILSEVSTRIELESVHVPSHEARNNKAICTARDALVGARTMLINSTRGWLRTQGLRVGSGQAETFTRRVRSTLAGEVVPHIEGLLKAIDALDMQIGGAETVIKGLAKNDAVCKQLMTMPGVGPITSVRFKAAVDDVRRFKSAHKLEAYFGLTPGEDSSSERVRRTSITKAGARSVRFVIVQAALTAKRCRPHDPMVRWALEIEKRRGKHIATVALARKMLGILFAMWRDNTTYQATRAAASPAT